LGFPEGTQGESARGASKTEECRQEERPTNKTQRAATEVRWEENLGFPEGTQGESARGVPNTEASRQEERPTNKTQRASDRGAVGRKLGVSRENARRFGQRGAQHRGRVAKRSAQPTKPKELATEVWWGENLGFPEGTQGESARGAPNMEASRQEERPTNKTRRASDKGPVGRKLGVSRGNARRVGQRGAQNRGELPRGAPNQQNRKSQRQRCGGEKTWGFQRERKASRPEGRPKLRRVAKRSAQPTKPKEPATEVRWGENLGFPEGTQGESARGAPKTEASHQEERPTNKTQRARDRGAVGRKLGVSRKKARGVGQRGAQNRGESPRGAPNQQNPKSQRQRCGGGKNLGFPEGKQGELVRGAPKTEASWQEERPNATQGELARWAPKRKNDPQRKRPHKGALG
jgi:hypothetical protein